VLNRRRTFAAPDSRRVRMAYIVVQLSGLACTVALVAAIETTRVVGHLAAYLAAAAPVTLVTFIANRTWTFGTQVGATAPRRQPPEWPASIMTVDESTQPVGRPGRSA
jgi:putative flippase GtrA